MNYYKAYQLFFLFVTLSDFLHICSEFPAKETELPHANFSLCQLPTFSSNSNCRKKIKRRREKHNKQGTNTTF